MEINAGYLQTENNIPDDWNVTYISEETKIIGGGTPNTSIKEYWNGQIPWVSAGDVSTAFGKRYIQDTTYHISDAGLSSCSAKVVPKGTTIIIARGATVGRMAQISRSMAFNQTCYGLLPGKKIDKDYLYYSVLFSVDTLNTIKYGSIFGTITTNSFDQWEILLPPLPEQHAIAETLSDVDALIATLDALITKKRAIKQGVMQELLTGKRRLSGFSREWETKELGEVSNLLKGSQLPKNALIENGRFAHLNGGISHSGFTDKFNTLGDMICISEGGNSCGYVQLMEEPFWSGGHCYTIKPKGINNHFLYHSLKNKQTLIMSLRVGSGLPNIQKKSLLNLELFFPTSLKEQISIAQVLDDIDSEINRLEIRLAKTKVIKQGMMQELLTGRIRLKGG